MASEKETDTSNASLRFQQGAHVLGMLVVAVVASYILPREGAVVTTLYNMIYVLSYAISFGVQFWMTFVNGLTLIKTLPRFWFGEVQSKMFPRYFTVVLVTNSIMLAVKFYHQTDYTIWSKTHTFEFFGTIITILSSVSNLFYLVPATHKLMDQMYNLEKEAGHADVIGRMPADLMKENKEYEHIRKKFIKLHGLAALLNLLTLMCGLMPAFSLASKM